jgi:tetratricopeptide (TPR) repeat protein
VCHTLDPDELARVTSHFDECIACQRVVLAAIEGGVGPAAAPVATDAVITPLRSLPVGPSLSSGTRIGRYELRALLGIGGMGSVYEAHDLDLDRAVALKVLRPELCESPGFAERFVRESRLMAKVTHPSVITVYDVGDKGEVMFIAMELVRGSTLAAWLRSHALDWRAIVSLFERAGQGLAAAHAAGIVHRDFKPDNVLVERDAHRVIVTDFGIAREVAWTTEATGAASSDDARAAPETAAIGTPAYMAPEQLRGRRVDRRADVFAFAASLWEALFDARPFSGATAREIYAAMQHAPERPTGARRVPGRLLRVLRKGLATEPDDRWPDLPSVLRELAAIRGRRKRVAIAAGAIGLVGLGIAAAVVARPAARLDPCASALALLDQAYNPQREAAVGDVLARDPQLRSAVIARLAATATAWRTTHAATCHADREIAQDVSVAACLSARGLELAGSVDDIIAHGPAAPAYATRISKLPADPAVCATPPPGLMFARVPADPALRRQVTALRDRLADAEDASDRGESQRALDETARIAAEAAQVWPAVHAEALYALGTFQSAFGSSALALTTLHDAATHGEAANNDFVAAQSWIELAYALASSEANYERELEYVHLAEAAAERIGRPPGLAIQLAFVNGTLLTLANRRDEAEQVLRDTVELARAKSPEDLPAVLQTLGVLYGQKGKYLQAIELLQKAIDAMPRSPSGELKSKVAPVILEQIAMNLSLTGQTEAAVQAAGRAAEIADRTWPETQIRRPLAHYELARILSVAGRSAEALPEITGVLAALEKLQGPRSRHYGDALQIRGEILIDLGRPAEAEPLLARACEISAFTTGDTTARYASCEVTDAAALEALHHHAEALARLDHAVATMIKSVGAAHPAVGEALILRGAAHAALGHHRAALGDFERAVELLRKADIEPGYLANAKWSLSKELWPNDPARARVELAAALSLFETTGGKWSKPRSAAAAWLARHGRSNR